jgi:DNA invertase Pin-like site-specific DNA recombinase
MAVMDGYIRVSRRNGRTGDSYLSPKIQRDTIERIAQAKGVTLGEIVEEEDVSGGKKIRDRGLGRLVEKVEQGASDGLIVWKISRFSRNLLDAVETMTRISAADGRLIADDFDSSAPMAKAMLGLLAGWSEEQLDGRRDDFNEARRRAIERGVHVGEAPVGYRRGPDGRLVVYEREARKVKDAFQRRADGESVLSIGRRHGWSHTNRLLANRTYLGEVSSGQYVNAKAHDRIVEPELFEQVNQARTTRSVPAGETTKDRLLVGLARCAGCGATLKVTRRKNRRGEQEPDAYYCRDASKTRCTARAFVHCDVLDAYVTEWFEGQLATRPEMLDAVAATQELDEALADEEEAKQDADFYATEVKVSNPARYQAGMDAREERLAAASARRKAAEARVDRLPEGGSLLALWRRLANDPAARRRVLGEWLDRVEVSRGASGGLAGRVRIFWIDGSLADDEDDARIAAA